MVIELPDDKIQRTTEILDRISKVRHCTIRKFATFVGTLVSRCPALKYGMIHVRRFEREKTRALELNDNNFNAKMSISESLIEDFSWWKSNIRAASAPMKDSVFKLQIFSDALRTGWGVFCNGHRSHGHWNTKDLQLHIN